MATEEINILLNYQISPRGHVIINHETINDLNTWLRVDHTVTPQEIVDQLEKIVKKHTRRY